MPGILGILGQQKEGSEIRKLARTLDPVSLCETKVVELSDGWLAAAMLTNNHLRITNYYEDNNYAGSFVGDLVGLENVPWKQIIGSFSREDYNTLCDLRGTFAISLFDKNLRRLSLVSDRISQQPIYYYIYGHSIVYSTSMLTYCYLMGLESFNLEWLYEFLYFNYPIGQTTFFKNVKRMPAATVFQYDLSLGRSSCREYVSRFARPRELLRGREALNKALSVFRECVPKYFDSGLETAVSLTGGLDSRTVLSFAPNNASLSTYTYGTPGCIDLTEAARIASTLGLPHTKVLFDGRLVDGLPELIYETVTLSGGLEKITRGILPYVYRTLTDNGRRFPIVVTGVSGDHLFRDHIKTRGNMPHMISADMTKVLHDGRITVNEAIFRNGFVDRFEEFKAHVCSVIEGLSKKYGELTSPASYVSFLVYEVTPKHFSGEVAIANNFTTFRTPYWDPDIIALSYEIEYATLGFSEALPKKDKYLETLLQSFLIGNNASFSMLPFRGMPLKVFSSGRRFSHHLSRVSRRGFPKVKALMKREAPVPLEDWSNWFKTSLTVAIDTIVSKNCLLSDYIAWEVLERAKRANDLHWISKFVTCEIILGLIKNGVKL